MTRLLQRSAFISAFAVVLVGIVTAGPLVMLAGFVSLVLIMLWVLPE